MSEPTWVPCMKRQEVELIDRDGSSNTLNRCTHQACASFGRDLKQDDCSSCPLRIAIKERPPGYCELPVVQRDFGQPMVGKNGTLVYPRTGFEPPVVPEGYVRKSQDMRSADAWVFYPTWPACADREQVNTVRPCGCIKINSFCNSGTCPQKGQKVTVAICRECPYQRPE